MKMLRGVVPLLLVIFLAACGGAERINEGSAGDYGVRQLTGKEMEALRQTEAYQQKRQENEAAALKDFPEIADRLKIIGVEHVYDLEPNVLYHILPSGEGFEKIEESDLTAQSAVFTGSNRMFFDPDPYPFVYASVVTDGYCIAFAPPRPLTLYTYTAATMSGPSGSNTDIAYRRSGSTVAGPGFTNPAVGIYFTNGTHTGDCEPNGGSFLKYTDSAGEVYLEAPN
jgi:hypothetical protein